MTTLGPLSDAPTKYDNATINNSKFIPNATMTLITKFPSNVGQIYAYINLVGSQFGASPATELDKWFSENSSALSTLKNPSELKVSSWAIVVDLKWETIFNNPPVYGPFTNGVSPDPVA